MDSWCFATAAVDDLNQVAAETRASWSPGKRNRGARSYCRMFSRADSVLPNATMIATPIAPRNEPVQAAPAPAQASHHAIGRGERQRDQQH